MTVQTFSVVSKEGTRQMNVHYDTLIAVGFAGRDQKAVKHHIDELAAIGVRPPSKTPIMYPCSTNSLVRSEKLQVVGRETSGEVEFVVVLNEGEIYVGIGSDHTDRGLETVGISKAKQIWKAYGPSPLALRRSKRTLGSDQASILAKKRWQRISLSRWYCRGNHESRRYLEGGLPGLPRY